MNTADLVRYNEFSTVLPLMPEHLLLNCPDRRMADYYLIRAVQLAPCEWLPFFFLRFLVVEPFNNRAACYTLPSRITSTSGVLRQCL